jgi:hypothetical protein
VSLLDKPGDEVGPDMSRCADDDDLHTRSSIRI